MLHNFLRGAGNKKIEYVGGSYAIWSNTANGTPAGFISTSLTSLTGGIGSTAMPGDFVLVVVAGTMNTVSTDQDLYMVTSGYTEVCDLWSNDASRCNLAIFYKIMGSTPDTVADGSTATDDLVRLITAQVWRGVNINSPLDVTSTTATGIDSGSPNPPSITPANMGSLIVAVGCEAGYTGSTTNALLLEVPNGMDLKFSELAYDTSSRPRTGVGIATYPWISGAYDPGVFLGREYTYCSWCAATLALRLA